MEDEDLIQREDMVVTVSHAGYVKRVPLSTYRAQRRGGKGRAGMQTREEDFVTRLFVASTHTPVLFFSSRGQVYKEKVWRLPLARAAGARQGADQYPAARAGREHHHDHAAARGRATWDKLDVMFATTRGTVRRNKLSDFADVRRSGIIAMKLDEGDAIVDVQICKENDDVLLTSAARPVHPLRRQRRARVPGPHLDGRARHQSRRRRQADLAVDPAPRRGDGRRARRLSQARQCGAARRATATARTTAPTAKRPRARSSLARRVMS